MSFCNVLHGEREEDQDPEHIVFSPEHGPTSSQGSLSCGQDEGYASQSPQGSPFQQVTPSKWKFHTPPRPSHAKKRSPWPWSDSDSSYSYMTPSQLNLVFSDAEPGSTMKHADVRKVRQKQSSTQGLGVGTESKTRSTSASKMHHGRVIVVRHKGNVCRFRISHLVRFSKHCGQQTKS